MSHSAQNHPRRLILVFGDQLNQDATVFADFDPAVDAVWMAEVDYEAKHVWTAKQRIAVFLAAMRHFRDELRAKGWVVHYTELGAHEDERFSDALKRSFNALKPGEVYFTRPGEWRVMEGCERLLKKLNVAYTMFEDDHFFTTPKDFAEHAEGRKALRMEFFYRELRKKTGYLMDSSGKPAGGEWNYDKDNRQSFSKSGPDAPGEGPVTAPDELTQSVIQLVNERFAKHPGSLDHFKWPVSRRAALHALRDFIDNRLARFGDFQDAMWINEPWLFHSWISAALNLKLLNPREVCEAAEAAWVEEKAPLNAVEGFIRQILGWREYVRGVYWHYMPEYVERNALKANVKLPDFYWTGETEYRCLSDSIGQTLQYGYAHHIQRLMVTGLYSLLLGVDPKAVHEWYLAVYVDAVEWVELPNTLGMSQYADGGIMASKPYAATGKYIDRMSNYCRDCPKDPSIRVGPKACPFTTLYWDFLLRNEDTLRKNQRMSLQVRNIDRLSPEDRTAIQAAATDLKG